jgi:hypothetical protein
MSSDDKDARFEAAVTAMTLPENRFDVTIICTTDDHQAEFWMSKLNVASAEEQFPMVLAVSEDWGGSGAGNGLGTLYAWKKACNFAKEKFEVDLQALLGEGKISASLYHTAGKGTRMAPLPASENNNKPGVVRSTHVDHIFVTLLKTCFLVWINYVKSNFVFSLVDSILSHERNSLFYDMQLVEH